MRRVFFSFDWCDVWPVNQIRKSWVTKSDYDSAGFIDSAEIEKLKKSTDSKIKNWINKQLSGTSVTCVLIGFRTSNRKWVKYEIQKNIKKRNDLLGAYIHNVKDRNGETAQKGEDPFLESLSNLKDFFEHYHSRCSYYDWNDDNGRRNLGGCRV